VMAMKSAIALAELTTLGILASLLGRLGVPLAQLAIYAWNPLVLVEIWGSGHLDGLVILFVVAAVHLILAGRGTAAAAMLGLGTLVKIYPAFLLPLFLGSAVAGPSVAFAVVILVGYAPFAHLGGGAFGSLSQYVSTEYFNPGLVRSLVDSPTLTLLAVGAWVLLVSFWQRRGSLVDRVIVLITGITVLSPNVFPWYALWLVPFLAVRPSTALIAFTGTLGLAYTFFLSQPWTIPVWARVAEFAPLVVGGACALKRELRANRIVPRSCLTSRPAGGPP
jgi:alpha-1,6-mannosyltransferase